MQFHLNGFEPGDPEFSSLSQRPDSRGAPGPLPEKVDVLIVGSGPAGLTLAAQLSAFSGISVCIVEQKPGRLLRGQADGIACRTMEMFHAFGFSERVAKEAYWVNEVTFWKPDEKKPSNIARNGRVQDTEEGLSEFPHVILNQARVHDFFLDVMERSPTCNRPYYSRRLMGIEVDQSEAADMEGSAFAVTARIERLDPGHENEVEEIKARYVVGCDGARSTVRSAIGRTLQGDSANQAWGVMDILAVTDFPDVRLKCLIQSANEGSILIIPREGGYLVRMYIELDNLNSGERIKQKNITADYLVAAAKRILHPYSLDVKEIAWWSVYEIGQRLCDGFDDVHEQDRAKRLPRVFIAGDACHTHSPKAGQGMNVSMQDGFNLGWKLAAVLQGRSAPHLLHTYSTERQAVAAELIEFDREWARLVSASKAPDPAETQRYFIRHGRYTAGTATQYHESVITGEPTYQHLARDFVIGTRFHSAPVIRFADAKPFQLGHSIKADGRWRLFLFADPTHPAKASSKLRELCKYLETSPNSPIHIYTPAGSDTDAVFDVRAVFQQSHRDLRLEAVPPLLLPRKGRFGLIDYEKLFCPAGDRDDNIFHMRRIDRVNGCIVLVRPDQYISHVLPLDAHDEIDTFFARFMKKQD